MTEEALPNSAVGGTTETAGFFDCPAATLVGWLVEGLGDEWSAHPAGPDSVASLLHMIPAGGPASKYLVLDMSGWAVVFTDGTRGTDVGVLPLQAAHDLGVTSIRAVAVDPGSSSLGAAILEVFDPSSNDQQLCRRSIYAALDGSRWRFGESGARLPFEDTDRYTERKVRDRFPPALVRRYLGELGAPQVSLGAEATGFLVERT